MGISTPTPSIDDPGFRAADLVRSEGTGDRAEDIIKAAAAAYPEELQAAQLRRENPKLAETLPEDAAEQLQRILGTQNVPDLRVRGDRAADAVVTYAVITADGDVAKGFLPLSSLLDGTDVGHVSQRTILVDSEVAQKFLADNPSPAAVAAEELAERDAEIERLKAQLAKASVPEPVPGLAKASAEKIAQAVAKTDLITAAQIAAWERQTRETPRKTVIAAVEARIAELSAGAPAAAGDAGASEPQNDAAGGDGQPPASDD